MRIAFVGKGGSGKSTISAEFTQFLSARNESVLAIDLDYNMDFAYNLGVTTDLGEQYLSYSRKDFYDYLGISPDQPLKAIADQLDTLPAFDPDSADDWYTKKYAVKINDATDLMVVGPLPSSRLYGKECGHVYMSSVRYYLPLLNTSRHVVLDSTAGTDLVSFGMYQGVDAIVCVVEPRSNSIRVFEQIKPIAEEFNIPLFIFANKVESDDVSWLHGHQEQLAGQLPFCNVFKDHSDQQMIQQSMAALYDLLMQQDFDPALRQSRLTHWKKQHDQMDKAA